jgi:hypothetical protein
MAKHLTAKAGHAKKASLKGYKAVATLSDGVTILAPKGKPKHFTSKEVKATIRAVRRKIAAAK